MEIEKFDSQRIYRMTKGDPNTLREVIDLFVDDTRKNLQRLRTAIDEEDNTTSGETAHALKGSAANMSARRLSELFHAIEEKVKSEDFTGARSLMRLLDTEFRILQQIFADLVSRKEGGID